MLKNIHSRVRGWNRWSMRIFKRSQGGPQRKCDIGLHRIKGSGKQAMQICGERVQAEGACLIMYPCLGRVHAPKGF